MMLSQQIKFCIACIILSSCFLLSNSVKCNIWILDSLMFNCEPRQNTDSFDVVQNSQAG